MTNWHLISVPQGWTECEQYGNAIIATRNGWYKGFGVRYETRESGTRAAVRRNIDKCVVEKL